MLRQSMLYGKYRQRFKTLKEESMAKQFLGAVNIDKKSTDYINNLRNELEHYEQGGRWFRFQKGIEIEFTNELQNIIEDIKYGLDLEYENIRQQVVKVYPEATGYDLGDGVVYVWRE